eukprot:TCONS_00005801-protein
MSTFLEGARRSVLQNLQELINELTSNVLTEQETKLYDADPEAIVHRSNNNTLRSEQIPNGLEDFTIEDDIFEEFNSISNAKNEILEWRDNRIVSKCLWFFQCFYMTFFMIVTCTVSVSLIVVGLWYLDFIVFDGLQITHKQVTNDVIEWFFMCWMYLAIMSLIFTFKFVRSLSLSSLNAMIALIGCVYKLFIYLYSMKDEIVVKVPLNVLFAALYITNSSRISRKFYKGQLSKQMVLFFQLSCQFIYGSIIFYATKHLFLPRYKELTITTEKLIFLVLCSLALMICRTLARTNVQNMCYVNHPGSTYILLSLVNALTISLYRIRQSEMDTLWQFTVFSFIIGLFGLLEKITMVIVDHFFIWMYRKCIVLEKDMNSYVGKYRTPRSQRLLADNIVCSVIQECCVIAISNAIYQLNDGHIFVTKMFGIRTLLALILEFIFSLLSVFLVTWYFNIPVLKTWRKRWGRFFLVTLLTVLFPVFLITRMGK